MEAMMADFIIFLLNPVGAIAWAFGCLLVLVGINIVIEILAALIEILAALKGEDDE
jgi:hypothetical protein